MGRLNPCFNGRYSQSKQEFALIDSNKVLILVLMEDTLRVRSRMGLNQRPRLNPCFNGRYSQRSVGVASKENRKS